MEKEFIVVPVSEDNDEKPPSKKQEVDDPLGIDGGNRCHLSLLYLSSVLLCRGAVQSRRMVWETLGNHGNPNILQRN